MSTWKPSRHPDQYPAHWHSIVQLGNGEYVVAAAQDNEVGRRRLAQTRRRMKAFWASLRLRPLHPTTQALDASSPRLTIRSTSPGVAALFLVLTKKSKILRQRD